MEENNTQTTSGGCRQRLMEFKTSIINTLEILSEGVYPSSPMWNLIEKLKREVAHETNETILYHKLKILGEMVQDEAKGAPPV